MCGQIKLKFEEITSSSVLYWDYKNNVHRQLRIIQIQSKHAHPHEKEITVRER